MTLGDLGADVLKIERPPAGDETRGWGPPFDARGESAYYLSVNRNKISAALDLDDSHDVKLLRALASEADGVIDNFRPGTLERRGLSIEGLLAENPGLLWCTLTGFGPDSARPGYDFVVQAESGWMAITGDPDGRPMKVGVALADVLAGKEAAVAILAGLTGRGRERTPEERRTFISLSATAVRALVNVAQNVLVSGRDATRWGNAHANLVPYQMFEAADRPIVIAVGSDDQWRSCARALGLDALADDDRLATNAGRLAHRTTVVEAMGTRVATRPAAEWLSSLAQVGVPAGIVRSVREALADVEVSPLTGVAPNAPGSVRLPPPLLDEHGALVRVFGWDAFRNLIRHVPQ